MGFKSDGIRWKWEDKSTTADNSYTTTTTTDAEELKVKARKWNGEFIANSPTTPTIITYGWVCPKCGCVNAPWTATCSCSMPVMKVKINTDVGIPEACRSCSNHPSNGGSGICNCTLGTPKITC